MSDLTEEFLEDGWPTYALVELKGLDDDGFEGVDRLDRLTKILAKGSTTQKEEAQKMLRAWLQKKSTSTHPLSRKLRLRRAFILKRLRQFDSAIIEVKQLLDAEPDSPTLNCLLGNLYGWLGNPEGWKASLTYFDKAIDKQDDWWEPRFERLGKMMMLGVADPVYWNQVVASTQDWINRSAVMTERERLIVMYNNILASVLIDPNYIATPEYGTNRYKLTSIVIPDEQLEDWDIEDDYKYVVKAHYSGDDDRNKSIRTELWKFMEETQKKLMPTKVWLPL